MALSRNICDSTRWEGGSPAPHPTAHRTGPTTKVYPAPTPTVPSSRNPALHDLGRAGGPRQPPTTTGHLLVVWPIRSLFLLKGRNFVGLLFVLPASPTTQSFDPCPQLHPQPWSEGPGRQLWMKWPAPAPSISLPWLASWPGRLLAWLPADPCGTHLPSLPPATRFCFFPPPGPSSQPPFLASPSFPGHYTLELPERPQAPSLPPLPLLSLTILIP